MKTAKLTLMFLACAAAIPAFAQNTTDSRCGTTNYDSSRNIYTITNPTGTATQQCFINVVPKSAWTGGSPNLATSQLVEGNYDIALEGGGGGGGGGAGRETDGNRSAAGGGGNGGNNAVPVTTTRYLAPGTYRLTIGAGGKGGIAGSGRRDASTHTGGRGADGGPTSLSNAYSGETVAGFPRAEAWDGTYPLTAIAYSGAPAAGSTQHGADGGKGGSGGMARADAGSQGGNGFIQLALKDPVQQAAPVQAAPAAATQTYVAPAPAATRPAKKDRN
jgi:hypothetical protein